MKEVILYEYQAKTIENTLRLVSNLLESQSKTTCLDRDIIQSWEFMKNALAEEHTKQVSRM